MSLEHSGIRQRTGEPSCKMLTSFSSQRSNFIAWVASFCPCSTICLGRRRTSITSPIAELETIAGRGSALHKEHGMYLQHVTIADVPEDFAARLTELFPGSFARLRLFALDVHDLVLAKLARNSPVDLEDAKFLAKAGRLDERVLKARYAKELRPYLANESRHDLTLKLWLEACFPS